jgi:hypothetical protein
MTDISIDSTQAADGLLRALGEQLAAQRECFTLAVVGWLNPGPTSLLDLGLPESFFERAQRRHYGPGLEVLFASRVDQIHLKLYATVDQGAGKHFEIDDGRIDP